MGLRERAPKKKVSLELGNATPVIVDETADLDDVTARVATHGYSFAGQSCISIQRVYVQRAAYDEFLAKDTEGRSTQPRRSCRRGDRRRPGDRRGRTRPHRRVDRGGAFARSAVLTGGGLEGELIQPTLIADAPADVKVSREEVFGPVVVVDRTTSSTTRSGWRTRRATACRPIFTQRIDSHCVPRRARVRRRHGQRGADVRADQMPYGGAKDSGNTREDRRTPSAR